MKSYKITLLPGDGIGPEITNVTHNILDLISNKFDFKLNFKEMPFGGSAIESDGIPFPNKTLQECKNSDAVLLAAIGDPKYDQLPREKRPETGLLKLRSSLDLFANIRPVKIIPSLTKASSLKEEYVNKVDLVVVRELTSGIYFGEPKGRIKTESGVRAFNTMTYTSEEVKRIAEIAFKLAQQRNQKVCSVDKANVLDVSQLWREETILVSNNFKGIDLTHQYVDNAAMQLVRNPSQFDVILTSNLFGDILSDIAAMLTGSIGMLPSASLTKDGPGVFEPVHGSAPDIAGKDIANPIAMILSAAMMLKIAFNEIDAGNFLENAINELLTEGYRTPDLMSSGKGKQVGCKQMGELLVEKLK
ncbi:3-isopropylmalate dehydrogenase [Prochlorococcus marinus]|uniref:3-isopropylmalate dehydrogenase n=1 Tax=Prochlorococcus marinus XMU1408 TaxID=2213228 RepID=A0A318RGJ6_PROMR|nr:3-isopropylmalate dehydrogenase [Prochlorococcus marinus]MBW3041790.1 3-isopropylmalate dehydrogenase [Prochlorococcus marinus str. XMU1408]PYE02933.1 3-isopropylmalate dehydrogenase [Prochlorococcus marinus XMU1408]